MSRYDIVIYGGSGFAGMYIIGTLAKSPYFEGVTVAVAGRSKARLEKSLDTVSNRIGKDVRKIPIIIADSDDPNSLAEMAKQAKVIINAVGPYWLYGEPVIRAAIENGAHHLDISGEANFLEAMVIKYNELAKQKNVFVVGACGWDSIPADLGVQYLKNKFDGDLNYVEAFLQIKYPPQGYPVNNGTYQTIVLNMAEGETAEFKRNRRALFDTPLKKERSKAPWRFFLSNIHEKVPGGWCIPFMGCDASVVERSQYYGYNVKGDRPIHMETYIRISTLFWALAMTTWLSIFFIFSQIPPTRKLLQKYPDACSFGMFAKNGPSEEQIAGAGFTYYFQGAGYQTKLPQDQEHTEQPNKKMLVTCSGPDMAYVCTSGCIISSALALLKDEDKLPKTGGVFSPAAAFRDTKIYDYLKAFDVHFSVENEN